MTLSNSAWAKKCGQDEDEWPGRTEEIVPAVRRALGDDVALLVDANSCYTPARAIEVGKMLQDYGVCHLKSPAPIGARNGRSK